MTENWQYYGLLLNEEDAVSLKETLPDLSSFNNARLFLHHCTLLHRSQVSKNTELKTILDELIKSGKVDYMVEITGLGKSDKAVAYSVKIPLPSANKNPHITIFTYNGGKPVDSNLITQWESFKNPIKVRTKLARI